MELVRRGRKRRLGIEDEYWQLSLVGMGTVEAQRVFTVTFLRGN